MKRFLITLVAVVVLGVAPAQAAITQVQAVAGNWSSGSSMTAAITATNGNLLAVSVIFLAGNGSNNVSGITDGTNTYTQIDTFTQSCLGVNSQMFTYYAKSITGGSLTVTVNFTETVVDRARVIVHEISGADTSAPLDKNFLNEQLALLAGTDAVTSGSQTTTTNGQYIFGATFACFNVGLTHGTGFTDGPAAVNYGFTEYLIQGAAGAIAATFTNDAVGTFHTAIATFKAAAASGCTGGLMLLGAGKC